MSRRRKNKNVRRHNNSKNDYHNTRGSQPRYFKLFLHKNLKEILKRILDNGHDPIAFRLLSDSKKSRIQTNISWLNITVSDNYWSYAYISKVKNNIDEAWDKQNRVPVNIYKIVKKIYKKNFSNKQIKSFVAKYRRVYGAYTSEQVSKERGINNDDILNKVLDMTYSGYIKWKIGYKTKAYTNYKSRMYLTDRKYISIDAYVTTGNIDNFIVFYLVTDDNIDSKILIKRINDDDGVWLLENEINSVNETNR